MTIMRDGEVVALYLESEVVCPRCVTTEEQAGEREEGINVEELEDVQPR